MSNCGNVKGGDGGLLQEILLKEIRGLQKENKALKEENKALKEENKALKEENKALKTAGAKNHVSMKEDTETQTEAPSEVPVPAPAPTAAPTSTPTSTPTADPGPGPTEENANDDEEVKKPSWCDITEESEEEEELEAEPEKEPEPEEEEDPEPEPEEEAEPEPEPEPEEKPVETFSASEQTNGQKKSFASIVTSKPTSSQTKNEGKTKTPKNSRASSNRKEAPTAKTPVAHENRNAPRAKKTPQKIIDSVWADNAKLKSWLLGTITNKGLGPMGPYKYDPKRDDAGKGRNIFIPFLKDCGIPGFITLQKLPSYTEGELFEHLETIRSGLVTKARTASH